MARVGEFCASNIARLLLGVVIVLVLVAALGEWLYHSPGRGTPIERPAYPQSRKSAGLFSKART